MTKQVAFLFGILLILEVLKKTEGFPNGAPSFVCAGLTPLHSMPRSDIYHLDLQFYGPQTGDSNIRITTNPTSYNPGQIVNITVESTNSEKMKGIILVVNRKNGDRIQPLGSFIECTPQSKVKFVSYFPQEKNEENCVMHKIAVGESKIQCMWKTPKENEGDLEVATTIAREKKTFWFRITKDIPALTATTINSDLLISPMNLNPSLSECGSTKSCFVYPKLCNQVGNCQYILTYKVNPINKTMNFELAAENKGWIAMGLSKDEIKDKDFLVICLETKEKGEVTMITASTAYTAAPGTTQKFHYVGETVDILKQVTNRRVSIKNDQRGNPLLMCSFDIPFRVSVEFPGMGFDPVLYDLEKEDVFVFMGDGATISGTNSVSMHKQRPLMSPKTRLTKDNFELSYFDGALKITRIHGTLQIIAWMFCSSLGVIIARHFRPNLSKLVNKGPYKQWLLWHILLIVIATVLSLISLIYILASNGLWKIKPTVHGALGIVTVSLGIINIVMGAVGVLKCPSDLPKRKIFDWGHSIVGLLTRVLAIITFWLAIRISGTRDMFDLVGTIIVAIWTGGEICFFIYFYLKKKIHFWRYKYELHCANTHTSIKEVYRSDSYKKHAGILSFLFYFVFIVGVTMALLFAVWLY